MGQIASRFTWVFGTDPDKSSIPSEGNRTHGAHNNVVGYTGAGVAFNTHGWGADFSFYVENQNGDTSFAYQLRTARTSSGPWAVFSSGTLNTSLASVNIVQIPGPFAYLSPRVKALASTLNAIVIRMTAWES